MMSKTPVKDYSITGVLGALANSAEKSGVASGQVFLQNVDDVAAVAAEIVPSAAKEAGGAEPSVGRVSKLAKSFSLTAGPGVFEVLSRDPRVKSILPSEIDDIYPHSLGPSDKR